MWMVWARSGGRRLLVRVLTRHPLSTSRPVAVVMALTSFCSCPVPAGSEMNANMQTMLGAIHSTAANAHPSLEAGLWALQHRISIRYLAPKIPFQALPRTPYRGVPPAQFKAPAENLAFAQRATPPAECRGGRPKPLASTCASPCRSISQPSIHWESVLLNLRR